MIVAAVVVVVVVGVPPAAAVVVDVVSWLPCRWSVQCLDPCVDVEVGRVKVEKNAMQITEQVTPAEEGYVGVKEWAPPLEHNRPTPPFLLCGHYAAAFV